MHQVVYNQDVRTQERNDLVDGWKGTRCHCSIDMEPENLVCRSMSRLKLHSALLSRSRLKMYSIAMITVARRLFNTFPARGLAASASYRPISLDTANI